MKLDLALILTQALGFLIIFLILKRYAWKPLLSFMDERRNRIVKDFEDIEKAKREVEELKRVYEQKLATIDDEAKAKIRDAVLEAQKVAGQIHEKARVETKELIHRTKESLELEVAKAKIELRDAIAELAIRATEKLIRERLDDAKHRALVNDFIAKVHRSN